MQSAYESTNVKLSFRERLNYSVAEFGYNSIYVWISAFVSIFYTDYIGVPLAVVSAMLLVGRVVDGIIDPAIGSFCDRTHTRWGRYKPWIAVFGVAMSVVLVLTFAAQPHWSMTTKMIWMWVFYILAAVSSSCCNMPYGALGGVITSDTGERAKLSGLRMVFSNVGSNFTNLIAASLILLFSGTNRTQNTAQGYMWAVVFCVVLGLPTLLWSAVKSKERIQPPPQQMESGKIPMNLQIKCLIGNRYALICLLGQFANGFLAYGRMAIMAYYFTYYAGDFSLYSYIGVCGIIGAIVGAGFLCPFLFKVFQHKGRALACAYLCAGLLLVPLFWFGPQSLVFWACYLVSNMCTSAASALRYSCDGDVADFAEYKYGVRVDGFLASFISLMLNIGGAVGPAVLIAWLDNLGYVPNVAQNASVLNALNLFMSFVPAALCLINAVGYFAVYNMDSKKHAEIVKELERRRGITAS